MKILKTNKKYRETLASCDSLMAIWGFTRQAVIEGNVIKIAAFEPYIDEQYRDDGQFGVGA